MADIGVCRWLCVKRIILLAFQKPKKFYKKICGKIVEKSACFLRATP
jgi:hypothetical protein